VTEKSKKEQGGRDSGDEALDRALEQIERQFGQGSVMRLGEAGRVVPTDAISTGALTLDHALGVGGVPRGRVVEIFGPEGSGKTTLALSIIANAQAAGGRAAFVDSEHALDPVYAQRIGVDLDELLVAQPDEGEQALQIVDLLVRSNGLDIVAVDSVAALVPRAELEGEMGDNHVGLQARLMSQALRKLTGSIHRSRTCVIFINQIRMKIGVMWGSPETTPGGQALKFYSSQRLDIRRIGSIKEGDRAIGNATRVKVAKNKVAPPFRLAEFDIMFDRGISWEGSVLDMAVGAGIVTKQGSWLSFGETRLGQGRENAKALLLSDPALCEQLEQKVRERFGIPPRTAPLARPRSAREGGEKKDGGGIS